MTVIWRCQCPNQCEEGESCWSDVTQEDFLCDWCRAHCTSTPELALELIAVIGPRDHQSADGNRTPRRRPPAA